MLAGSGESAHCDSQIQLSGSLAHVRDLQSLVAYLYHFVQRAVTYWIALFASDFGIKFQNCCVTIITIIITLFKILK